MTRTNTSKASIFKPIFACKKNDILDSTKETILLFFVTLIPILITAFLLSLDKKSDGYFCNIYKVISNGELFLLSSSLLSPIFYIVMKNRNENFPWKNFFLFSEAFVILISTAIFITQRYNPKPDNYICIKEYYINLSMFMFFICTMIYFLASLFNNMLYKYPAVAMQEEVESEANAYTSRYIAHRGGKK